MSFLTKGQSRPASFRRYIDNPGSAREKTIKRNGGQRIRKVQRVTCGILSSHVTRSCSLSLVPLGSRAMRKACGAPLIILLLRRRAPHRLGCSRAALRQHRKNATTSLARSCCCRSSATGSRRRAPRRTCNGAPALAAPRAQYAPRAAPGGCPLPRVPFLEPQRGSYVNPALPSSRARGLEYMRALLQSMRMLRMYYRSCASCKIFCAAIPYPRLEVLKPN